MIESIGELAGLIGDTVIGIAEPLLEALLGDGEEETETKRKFYMSVIQFKDLPDHSRVWVFGSDRTLDANQEKTLMSIVDPFLQQWRAHGAELTVGRDWRAGRFLTIGVDQSTAGASGCSIDGLFRELKRLDSKLGASMRPLIGKSALPQRGGDLSPVANPVQQDVRGNLVLAHSHFARRESLEGEDLLELTG